MLFGKTYESIKSSEYCSISSLLKSKTQLTQLRKHLPSLSKYTFCIKVYSWASKHHSKAKAIILPEAADCLFIIFIMFTPKTSNTTLKHNFIQSKMTKQCHASQNTRYSFGHCWLYRVNKYTENNDKQWQQCSFSLQQNTVMIIHSCFKHLHKKSVHSGKNTKQEKNKQDDKMPDHHHIVQCKQLPASQMA